MDAKPKFKPLVVIQSYEDRESGRQFPSKVTERRSTLPLTSSETLQEKPVIRHSVSGPPSVNPPPPPPPPPFEDNKSPLQSPSNNQQAKPKQKLAPPVPVKYSTLSFTREKQEYPPQPPPCPTPDYDTISINSNSTLSKTIAKRFAANESKTSQSNNNNNHNDTVEMESLESFRLNNPSNSWPKPPCTYFNKPKTDLSSQLSNGSTCSTISGKKQRPVSVTIGEYPSGSLRKQPGKLDFLHNGHSEDNERNCNGSSISSQFATELAHTLSRSNLRKRTDSLENLLNGPTIKPQSNGSVTISLNNTLNRNFAKSTENLCHLRSSNGQRSNRVTISISSGDKKSDIPNGILKNGNDPPL